MHFVQFITINLLTILCLEQPSKPNLKATYGRHNIIIEMILFVLVWYVDKVEIRTVLSYHHANPSSTYKEGQMLTTCQDVEF